MLGAQATQTIIVLLFVLIIVACNPFMDEVVEYPVGLGSYLETGYYAITPETILASLDRGETKIFMPLLATPEANLFPSGSFPWRQQDYLKIANALSRFVWKDTLEDWKLYKMDFDKDCNDNPVGFDDAQITYFKTEGEQYTTREVDIYPLSKEVDWGGGDTHFPRPFFGWKSIDLEKLQVSADDALQIAETNGGKQARLAVKNECKILVVVAPNINHDSWDVGYYSGATTLFEMLVDPYSGSYRIISGQ